MVHCNQGYQSAAYSSSETMGIQTSAYTGGTISWEPTLSCNTGEFIYTINVRYDQDSGDYCMDIGINRV
jgi:hypothetical protein